MHDIHALSYSCSINTDENNNDFIIMKIIVIVVRIITATIIKSL